MHKQKCFSVIIKKLNLEILTKNLVTFKKQDGVKDELWGFIENSVNFFRGAHEKPIYRRGKGRGGGDKGEAERGKGGGGLITECILCSHQRLVFYFAINFGMP